MAESTVPEPTGRSSVPELSLTDETKHADLESQKLQPGSSSDSEGEVGRQIQMEAENSIKYRTCSWQKVRGRKAITGK